MRDFSPLTTVLTAPAYMAAAKGLVPAASPTNVCTITGSSTKTIRVYKIVVDGTQTTAGTIIMRLIKQSAADSGGAATNPAGVPLDSTQAAATATIAAYTGNPTPGASVGDIAAVNVFIPAPATVLSEGVPVEGVQFDFSQAPVVIRGTAEVLAIHLNGTTLTGGNLNISILYTES